jgi:protein-disulfide isomerase
MSKHDRAREAAAKRILERQQAVERRHKVTLWTSVAVVAVLVLAGVIGFVLMSGQEKKIEAGARQSTPSVAVDEGTAFAVGTGPVTVDLYEDFMCPVCHEFENATGSAIKQLVAEKKITVRYHPVSILDEASSGTRYSTRAAGAVAAAAVDGKFLEYHDVLFANQPAEGSTGLDDAKLIELGRSVGLGDGFAAAVEAKTYDAWVGKVTDTFAARGYNGTPTVVVNGTKVEKLSLQAFTDAVTAAAAAG